MLHVQRIMKAFTEMFEQENPEIEVLGMEFKYFYLEGLEVKVIIYDKTEGLEDGFYEISSFIDESLFNYPVKDNDITESELDIELCKKVWGDVMDTLAEAQVQQHTIQ